MSSLNVGNLNMGRELLFSWNILIWTEELHNKVSRQVQFLYSFNHGKKSLEISLHFASCSCYGETADAERQRNRELFAKANFATFFRKSIESSGIYDSLSDCTGKHTFTQELGKLIFWSWIRRDQCLYLEQGLHVLKLHTFCTKRRDRVWLPTES